MDRRRLATITAVLVALLVAGIALVVALRPFDLTVELGPRLSASGTCDAAASTAWQDGSKDGVGLWAVTVGTNMMGYTPVFGSSVKYVLLDGHEHSRFPGPYCVGEARHRMIVSGTILAAGFALASVALLLVHRRRQGAT
jgi:hypothetical protein